MKKILCATDLSLRSELALDRVGALARQFGAELLLLHVVDDDQPREMVEQKMDHASALLKARVAGMTGSAGLIAHVQTKSGNVFNTIVETAQASDADLLVMGAHRRRLLQDVIVGTTIERVMRTGRHPVLMVNSATLLSYESVLLALDASDASARAVLAAKSLGLLDNVRVSIVHAFEPIYKGMLAWAGVREESITEYSASWARDAAYELERFLEKTGLSVAGADVVLEEGPPFVAIKKVVERLRPHLLVIGTRGHTGLKRALLGSVAERVVSELVCDVLAVPLAAGSGG